MKKTGISRLRFQPLNFCFPSSALYPPRTGLSRQSAAAADTVVLSSRGGNWDIAAPGTRARSGRTLKPRVALSKNPFPLPFCPLPLKAGCAIFLFKQYFGNSK